MPGSEGLAPLVIRTFNRGPSTAFLCHNLEPSFVYIVYLTNSFLHVSSSGAFSVGTPPLHPSSLGTSHGHRGAAMMNVRGGMTSQSNNNTLGFSNTQFSPGSATPPAFAPGSFKSQASSPFMSNLSSNITGSSPPFQAMLQNSKGGENEYNGQGGTPIGIKTIKPTPSPPMNSYFTSPYASFLSGNYGSTSQPAKDVKDDKTDSLSHKNSDQSSALNMAEATLHSPWGMSLGIVAKRAGKECRYGAIDTTWVSEDRYSWRQVPRDDFESDSGLFYKIKKKKDGNENDTPRSEDAKSENEPASPNKPKNTDDEDDVSYGWYDNPLEVFEGGEAGSSLDALHAVLMKPRTLSVDTQTEIREVVKAATTQVEKAKNRLNAYAKERAQEK